MTINREPDKVELAGCAFALLWMPLTLTAAYLLRGWVLAQLWLWFVAPFFSVPALNVPQAIGIVIIVGMLTHQPPPSEEKKKESLWLTMTHGTFVVLFPPIFIYLIALVVRLFL